MKRKRLLLITTGFPYGNSEKSFLENEFSKLQENFNVIILALQAGDDMINPYIDMRPETIVLRDKKKWGISKLPNVIVNKETWKEIKLALADTKQIKLKFCRLCKIFYDGCLAERYKTVIRKYVNKYDVNMIYTYWCTQATLGSVRLKKQLENLTVISRLHGCDIYNERDVFGWLSYRKEIIQKIDKLFFVSETAKKYFSDKWGEDNQKYVVNYLGCKRWEKLDKRCNDSTDSFTIASCSNLIDLKRIDLIIKGLAEVSPQYRVKWIHLGEGEKRRELQDLADELLGPIPNVEFKFMGYVENVDINGVYNKENVNAFITTSESEGCPLTIQEALSTGLPIISTPVGAVPEIFDASPGFIGYLLDENPCPSEIASAIEKCVNLSADKRLEAQSNAIIVWEEKFNTDKNVKLFIEEIRNLMR